MLSCKLCTYFTAKMGLFTAILPVITSEMFVNFKGNFAPSVNTKQKVMQNKKWPFLPLRGPSD